MKSISSVSLMICYVGVGASMLSVLVPQKRTRRIMTFILGLFILVSVTRAVMTAVIDFKAEFPTVQDISVTEYSDTDYSAAVAKQTAENLVSAADSLLKSEGITASDIRLSLKISEEGRIYIDRADIYISEEFRSRTSDIESIIYRNFSKEPDIYVQ